MKLSVEELGNKTKALIDAYLREVLVSLDSNGWFEEQDHYGRAFALASLILTGQGDSDEAKVLLANVSSLTGPEETHHHEFIRFAAHLCSGGVIGVQHPVKIPLTPRFRGTRVANWVLLRSVVLRLDGRRIRANLLALSVRLVFSRRGWIFDDRKGFSLQYHLFSSALIGLLCRSHEAPAWQECWFREVFDASLQLTRCGREKIFVGRGALQIFGYASMFLLGVLGNRVLGAPEGLVMANNALDHLGLNVPGSTSPLVINNLAQAPPSEFDLLDERFAGWWSYNRWADYIPFTTALLALGCQLLDAQGSLHVPCKGPPQAMRLTSVPGPFRSFSAGSEEYLVSLPNNRIYAGALPLPYRLGSQGTPFPILGGEQRKPALTTRESYPLPIKRGEQQYFLDRKYRWASSNSYRAVIGRFEHRRFFGFGDREIFIRDQLRALAGVELVSGQWDFPRILLAQPEIESISDKEIRLLDGIRITFSENINLKPAGLSPEGNLVAITQATPLHSRRLTIFCTRVSWEATGD